mgnify:CR=1 FL=1
MSLDYEDRKLSRYFDALFVVGRMGDSKKELANLQKVMQAHDYAELLSFDEEYRELLSFVSRDEEDGASDIELKKLADYEKFIDKINIPEQYKKKMYECVLLGVDKFDSSNKHSLLLLGKILENTTNKDKNDIKRLQQMSALYQSGNKDLYNEFSRKTELKLKGKDPDEVKVAQERYKEISSELKKTHSVEERIKLLKEQLELSDKCAFKRMEKFQAKASICYNISQEYASNRDIFNKDNYLNDAQYYVKLVNNIKKHIK